MLPTEPCPCGTQTPYMQCCGRFIEVGAYPQTAELLMRSRYTAYSLANSAYLMKTWHPNERPELTEPELRATEWVGLDIIRAKPGLKRSIVEFKAYFKTESGKETLHEVSEFKKIKNRWVYVKAVNF